MAIHEQKRAPMGLTINEAAQIAGVGRSTIYEELASGRLSARKCGTRTIIPAPALQEWIDRLPTYRSPTTSSPKQPPANIDRYPYDTGESSHER